MQHARVQQTSSLKTIIGNVPRILNSRIYRYRHTRPIATNANGNVFYTERTNQFSKNARAIHTLERTTTQVLDVLLRYQIVLNVKLNHFLTDNRP